MQHEALNEHPIDGGHRRVDTERLHNLAQLFLCGNWIRAVMQSHDLHCLDSYFGAKVNLRNERKVDLTQTRGGEIRFATK